MPATASYNSLTFTQTIRNCYRWSSLLLLAGLMSGCATNDYKVASYDKIPGTLLPPITLYNKDASEGLSTRCEAFDKQSLLQHCLINRHPFDQIYKELKSSELFAEVGYGDRGNSDYTLLLTTATFDREDAKELGHAVLAGASLMFLPMVSEVELEVEATLMWNNVVLDDYNFKIPFTQRGSWFNLPDVADKELAESITSHLLKHYQDHNTFSPELIADRISANNYFTELQLPDAIGPYLKDQTAMFRHPFQGAQVRYIDRQFQYLYVDVFVYPIRQTSWEDRRSALEQELQNFRKDIELMEKESYYVDLHMSQPQHLQWRANGENIDALALNMEFVSREGVAMTSKMIQTTQKDKFIKIRTSHEQDMVSSPDLINFMKQLSQAITVPDESLFMAKVRKNWRDQRQN